MQRINEITVIMDGDIDNFDEEKLTDILIEKFKEKGYTPTDRPVVVRKGKMSSIRAVENDTQEEVEIYALAQVINKNGNIKTVITGRVV